MKTFLFTLLTVVALHGTALAQTDSQTATCCTTERANKHSQRLSEELNLSPEQAAKVKELSLKHLQAMEQLKAQRQAQRKAHQETKQNFDKELRAVLTPEQSAKLDSKREKMKERHHRRKNDRHRDKERY